jgi:hypothetical protein
VRAVTDDSNIDTQMVHINGEPLPIKITAMSLPWGGLLDIKGDWNPAHSSHNDGKEVDIGFGNLPDYDHRLLLRQVILDGKQFNINPCEGGINIIVARQVCVDKGYPNTQADHIHLNLKN